ncbi:hypothetical protein [Ruminococcus flavefaciens]|uniref:Uncharacterized protein n=1 Tax=Ruminococcus flavefaciens TaxID=1265 RepID=A0A315XZY3_RUMFL|nr:hypothetical protein [Ruminococcus flavefaciens]PWJ13092.1 hypothetical protein IE37_01591 [Ruminococcus flavefaciens]SSA48698.1 hypothetical protein SAMN02910325_01591 [Ruminococcus flavefaciens]
MFKKAGGKLKTIIVLSFSLSTLILFILFMFIAYQTTQNYILWLIIFLVAIIPNYIIHLVIFAFAELCENVNEIKDDITGTMSEGIVFISTNIYNINKKLNAEKNDAPEHDEE